MSLYIPVILEDGHKPNRSIRSYTNSTKRSTSHFTFVFLMSFVRLVSLYIWGKTFYNDNTRYCVILFTNTLFIYLKVHWITELGQVRKGESCLKIADHTRIVTFYCDTCCLSVWMGVPCHFPYSVKLLLVSQITCHLRFKIS